MYSFILLSSTFWLMGWYSNSQRLIWGTYTLRIQHRTYKMRLRGEGAASLRPVVIFIDLPLDVRQLRAQMFTPPLLNQVIRRLLNTRAFVHYGKCYENIQLLEKTMSNSYLFDVLQVCVLLQGILRAKPQSLMCQTHQRSWMRAEVCCPWHETFTSSFKSLTVCNNGIFQRGFSFFGFRNTLGRY